MEKQLAWTRTTYGEAGGWDYATSEILTAAKMAACVTGLQQPAD
jgi:hypothetical protein